MITRLRFDRPLVIFQSDDWGRVGVRDREGWEQLRAAGISLGDRPYDYYSLETATDLEAIHVLLMKHRDSVGRNPPIVMNFIMANVDFERCRVPWTGDVPLVELSDGLPGAWRRPGLFEAYERGISDGVFYPALHGLSHFCMNALQRKVAAGDDQALLRVLWDAQTPYIYWRMPWIAYEYWDSELEPESRFLVQKEQQAAIDRATKIFRRVFKVGPLSACAPGYRANDDTRAAWFEAGVRVAQNGPGGRKEAYLDGRGMLHTFRTIEMEPATSECDLASLILQAEDCFRCGLPAVVSVHSINFHSTLSDFRTRTLSLWGRFLETLEKKWSDLLYVHDGDLFQIATEGAYALRGDRIQVAVTRQGARGRV